MTTHDTLRERLTDEVLREAIEAVIQWDSFSSSWEPLRNAATFEAMRAVLVSALAPLVEPPTEMFTDEGWALRRKEHGDLAYLDGGNGFVEQAHAGAVASEIPDKLEAVHVTRTVTVRTEVP